MMSCLSLDLDPRTEMCPDQSSMGVAADGSSGELLEVEEHAFANVDRWW
jgi:hypothetical protein